MRLSRRAFVGSVAAALTGASAWRGAAAEGPARCSMGIVEYAIAIQRQARRQRKEPDLGEPLVFLQEADRLGAGGIQAALGQHDAEQFEKMRRFAETHAMRIEANIAPPRDAADVARFEKDVLAAKSAGAALARSVIMPGRRYEQFKSLEAFREAEQRGKKSLQLAEPVLSKHRFRLAVENHKDHRIDERLALFKRLSSEFIGACVDLGNSFTLLEDPLEVVKAYAPVAFTVHIKDQAVRDYPQGFEYADVALGRGFLDLPAMVEILRKARPGVTFNFESITRDALKVPVLSEGYWATFGQVPGSDLARTLRTVRQRAAPAAFPVISRMSPDEQVAAERSCIQESLRYARERLGL